MKGSYWFKAKSKKVLFEFSIRRNITVIKGDSATGKTTLLRILYEYLRIGRQSGYAVSTNASYYVYIRDEVGRDWKDALYPLKNTVVFIEENNEFVFTKEFASYVKESGNYFVFVTRAPLKMLPYSILEIYEIITDGKRTDIKESYHEFKEMYDMTRVNANGYFDSEDSEEARYAKKQLLNTLRTQEYRKGEYSRGGGCVPLPVPEDAPFFVKDYSEYYKGRCYHKRSLNSNDGWNSIGCMSFMNQPILKYSNEIRSAVLIVHGEKAHSYYFGKDAYENMIKDSKYTSNKELLTIPGAVHTDLYDNLDVIPFDKIQKFFEENGVG